ncbi:hypothetical protein BGX31_005075 [Mortierella sp. GBA43]|nr:hypothetical protein BGX31_005075 [Mortierella sp. GBA43]
MDLLGTSLQESARRAAGSFLSPLTNAIGEQRRLVDSLAIVSKTRVEECKHMMVWSKAQDVLIKMNLLIRKISDYEIRFGEQYEGFREKIKYLRTKDDSLCEMGRRQADIQTKILDASKSKLRSAKALLLQKELDDIQRQSKPTETKLQKLKREIIKDAYTEQLNAILELGKKMQIIGEHGKDLIQLLDHPTRTKADAHRTEDILQSARIALENWQNLVMVDPNSIVVHPPPSRTNSEISISTISSTQTLPVLLPGTATNSDSESDSDVEFVQAPSTPLKAKPSVVVTAADITTAAATKEPEKSQEATETVTAAHVQKEPETPVEKEPETPVKEPETPVKEEPETPVKEEPETPVKEEPETPAAAADAAVAEEPVKEEDLETPKQEKTLGAAFGSTLAPKLTLSPSKPKTEKTTAAAAATTAAPRSSDWASEATQALASVQGSKKLEDIIKDHDTSASEAETLRRLEELEMKQALELSLNEAHTPEKVNDEGQLQLTAEELRFIMGDVAPQRSTKVIKRKARAPEATDDSSPVSSVRSSTRRGKKDKAAGVAVDTEKAASHTDTESEQDVATPKPRVRGPQVTEPEAGNRMSQQGPRPWVPENADESDGEASETSTVDLHGPEELYSSSHVAETMGEEPSAAAAKPSASKKTPAKTAKSSRADKVIESMGPEPETVIESMGPEPEKIIESMGPEPERVIESMGDDGTSDPTASSASASAPASASASALPFPSPSMNHHLLPFDQTGQSPQFNHSFHPHADSPALGHKRRSIVDLHFGPAKNIKIKEKRNSSGASSVSSADDMNMDPHTGWTGHIKTASGTSTSSNTTTSSSARGVPVEPQQTLAQARKPSAAKGASRGQGGSTSSPKTFQCTGYPGCNMVFTRSEHLARHER